jgi:hypothetical protein
MKPVAATSLLALSLVTSCTAAALAEEKSSLSLVRDPRVVDAIAAWKEWVEYQAAINEVGPAIEKALKEPGKVPERDPALDRYTGVYGSIWGQSAIVRWEDGLAAVELDKRELKEALVKLKKTGEHVFRRVREDDEEQLGEEFVFDLAADGTVTRYQQHSNWSRRVR